jgi:lipopolysaccharide transport system permease protein
MAFITRLSASLADPWLVLIRHRQLIYRMVHQEIRTTYARTLLGLYWIVLLPVFYVLVFVGVRFVALNRGASDWLPDSATPETTVWQAFAIVVGLIVFWLGTEILTRSPGSVRKNASLVTDLRFPVEVLPWISVGLALFNFAVRFALFALAFTLLIGLPPWHIILTPVAVAPLVVLMIGVSYLFGAVGVFIADLEYVIQILMTALLLLSGILFPLTLVPEPYRGWLYLNPIATTVHEARKLSLFGEGADVLALALILISGLILAAVSCQLFRRLRPRFSDAL